MIVDAARRHYVNGETQADIAQELGVSASYLARRLHQAQQQGIFRLLIDDTGGHQAAIEELSPVAQGQTAIALNERRLSMVVDINNAIPGKQEFSLNGITVTIEIKRL